MQFVLSPNCRYLFAERTSNSNTPAHSKDACSHVRQPWWRERESRRQCPPQRAQSKTQLHHHLRAALRDSGFRKTNKIIATTTIKRVRFAKATIDLPKKDQHQKSANKVLTWTDLNSISIISSGGQICCAKSSRAKSSGVSKIGSTAATLAEGAVPVLFKLL